MENLNEDNLKEALSLLKGNYSTNPVSSESTGHLLTGGTGIDISMETIIGVILGTIMFSIGVYLVKKGKKTGTLTYVLSGVTMCVVPFFVMNPYIIVAVFIFLVLIMKYID